MTAAAAFATLLKRGEESDMREAGPNIRVLQEKGLGAIRLEKRSGAFFVLHLPLGAPEGSDALFLKGLREGEDAEMRLLDGTVPDRGVPREDCERVLERYLAQMLPAQAERCGVAVSGFALDCPRRAWALCQKSGWIRFSPQLCWMRRDVIREVALHELTHLAFPESWGIHSPAFWQRLTELEPAWPYLEGWLRGRGKAVTRHGFPV